MQRHAALVYVGADHAEMRDRAVRIGLWRSNSWISAPRTHMSIKHALRMTAQRFGVEVNRYNALQSAEARSFALLDNQRIDTILDVGANDGGHGRYLRRGGFAGTTISFEPLEKEHEALQAAADADGKWFVAPRMALGSENTEVEIHVAGNPHAAS